MMNIRLQKNSTNENVIRVCFSALWILLFLGPLACKKEVFWEPVITYDGLKEGQASLDLLKVDEKINVVILNFFAPDCPPCIEELPELQNIYDKSTRDNQWGHIGFYAIGSNLQAIDDDAFSKEDIKKGLEKFIQENKIQYPVFVATSSDIQAMGITGYPETFVLHRNAKNSRFPWRLVRKFISVVNEKDMNRYIFNNKPTAKPNTSAY